MKSYLASLFHSVSSRSAGLTTYDVTQFSEATDIFISSLMFIGASPSSVGGGIRTTTFAIALLFLINFARGNKVINVFQRQIKLIDVFRSYAVILTCGHHGDDSIAHFAHYGTGCPGRRTAF